MANLADYNYYRPQRSCHSEQSEESPVATPCHSEGSEESLVARGFFALLRMTGGGRRKTYPSFSRPLPVPLPSHFTFHQSLSSPTAKNACQNAHSPITMELRQQLWKGIAHSWLGEANTRQIPSCAACARSVAGRCNEWPTNCGYWPKRRMRTASLASTPTWSASGSVAGNGPVPTIRLSSASFTSVPPHNWALWVKRRSLLHDPQQSRK